MSQNYCHHVNATGVFCRGIPVKKREYCYWHLHENGRRMKAARARARCERVILQLPVLDDLQAVQVGLMQLAEAIAHGEIDHRSGRLLLAVLRLAAANIKAQGGWLDAAQIDDGDDTLYVSENVGFEKQYDLPQGIDLRADPAVAFPPPEENVPQVRDLPAGAKLGNQDVRAKFGQILRDAATPIPGTDFRATADDMELMDVYEREGEQAGLKRAAELERNRKRREQRERRIRYEEMARNRNLQLAAEKLVHDQQRSAGAIAAPGVGEHPEAESNRKPPMGVGPSGQEKQAGEGVA